MDFVVFWGVFIETEPDDCIGPSNAPTFAHAEICKSTKGAV
jgi:hypothetical protein